MNPLFVEEAAWIATILKMLNAAPTNENYYIHVEVRDNVTHECVGTLSDEIASDSWSFEAKRP